MKRLALILSICAALFMPVAAVLPVAADSPRDQVCSGIGLTTNGTCGDGGAQVSAVLTAVINLLLVIVGVVAVIMIILAGLNFITAGGDAKKVGDAKNAIVYAIIGLAIVLLAEFIVHFVIKTATLGR